MTELKHHYGQNLKHSQLVQQIKSRFPEGPSCYDLAPIDQLHIGGIKASKQLLRHVQQYPCPRVLDVGAGLGGLLRLASNEYEIEGVAVDFTHEFNQLNQALNQLSGCNHLTVVSGDAQALPLSDNQFDCVIFQHSLLNIPEPRKALQEALRVLKPGGIIICHEVVKGDTPEAIQFPVPWAVSAEFSYLETVDRVCQDVENAGFKLTSCVDWTEQALLWRTRQSGKEQSGQSRSGLNPAAILGKQFAAMGKNVQQALKNGAIGIIELTAKKPLNP